MEIELLQFLFIICYEPQLSSVVFYHSIEGGGNTILLGKNHHEEYDKRDHN